MEKKRKLLSQISRFDPWILKMLCFHGISVKIILIDISFVRLFYNLQKLYKINPTKLIKICKIQITNEFTIYCNLGETNKRFGLCCHFFHHENLRTFYSIEKFLFNGYLLIRNLFNAEFISGYRFNCLWISIKNLVLVAVDLVPLLLSILFSTYFECLRCALIIRTTLIVHLLSSPIVILFF